MAVCSIAQPLSGRTLVNILRKVIKQRYDEKIYKLYMAEAARAVVIGFTGFGGGNGVTMPSLLEVLGQKPKDKRTGDEIAADIIKRLF